MKSKYSMTLSLPIIIHSKELSEEKVRRKVEKHYKKALPLLRGVEIDVNLLEIKDFRKEDSC